MNREDRVPSYRFLIHGDRRGRDRSLEFGYAGHRRASQSLGVARDVTLPLALEAGHSAIECGHELTQVVDEALG
jgi:hypothetical protein